MILIALTLALAAGPATAPDASPPPPAVSVCNALPVGLEALTFDGDEHAAPSPVALGPGQCRAVRGLAPGAHVIHFIERSGARVGLCTQTVAVKPGEVVRLSPGDSAQCLQ